MHGSVVLNIVTNEMLDNFDGNVVNSNVVMDMDDTAEFRPLGHLHNALD